MRIPPWVGWVSPLAVMLSLSACEPGHEDTITGFHVEAEIHQDGTLTMSESITYDFGHEPSAGLLWELPLTVPESPLRHRALELTDLEVSSPSGAPAGIEARSQSHGWISLEIGDEDAPVTGEQTYVVSYALRGALTAEDGADELYWDFIGTGWGVPISDADVRVTAPDIAEVYCYTGEDDDETPCETASHQDGTAHFAEDRLAGGEGITAIVELPPGTVEIGEADRVWRPLPRWLTWSGVASLIAGLGVLLVGFKLVDLVEKPRRARERKRFPRELPRVNPAVAGLLYRKDKLRTEHLLAMLVGLEERGVITSAPHPKRDNDWLFRLADPHEPAVSGGTRWPFVAYGPGVSRAEGHLLDALLSGRGEGDLKRLESAMKGEDTPRSIRRELIREARRAGLVQPVWTSVPSGALIFVAIMGPFLLPVAVGDLTPFNPTGLESVGLVIGALSVPIVVTNLVPFHRTRYGEHVRRLLAKARQDSDGLDPALAVALDLRGDALAKVPEIVADAYYHDERYRERWDSQLGSAVKSANSSSSGGGGGSVGGGGGGSGGGRR